jgi:PKD repeat protein
MFGSTAATGYTFVSDSVITASAPAEAVGMVDITVITSGGTSSGTSARSTADEYTYTAATTTIPTVTSISPTYGPVSVGTPITITGTGFTGATAVTIGGTAATSVVVVSDTEITATTPASSSVGQVDVTVTTPSGTSATVSGDQYTFAEAATTVPLPLFSASPTSGAAPLEVEFEDESTGSPASWSWSFGDGNTSTLEDPTYTYLDNGTYSVTLTEQNSLGENATTETDYIVVGGSGPAADFTATPTSGTAPLTVQFTDTSTGSPTTWLWDFGDGTTDSDESPSHSYTSPGVYSVSLIASNSDGSNTFSQPDAITVSSVTTAPTDTGIYTPLPTTADTFAIPAATQQASDSSSAAWLQQENAKSAAMAVATPANGSSLPPVISLISLVCVVLFLRKNHQ